MLGEHACKSTIDLHIYLGLKFIDTIPSLKMTGKSGFVYRAPGSNAVDLSFQFLPDTTRYVDLSLGGIFKEIPGAVGIQRNECAKVHL